MADPEARAAEVLAGVPSYVWDGRTLPVPVEDIADSVFGLHIGEVDDLRTVPGAPQDAELSGLLVVDDRWIWVNAAEAAASPGRRRFTIGHELGHWVMHAPTGKVFCRASLEAPQPDIEEEASLFSGALMFPTELVRSEYERSRDDLTALCERFGGSRVATERAVFRAVRRPELEGLTGFFYDDPGYEAWLATHEGFVVNDDLLAPAGAKLHHTSCHYLRRAAKPGQPRTRHPKWCSDDLADLRTAFPQAVPCSGCRPVR